MPRSWKISHILPLMQSLWIIAGLLIGGLAVFFLIRPRLKSAEAKAVEEHNRSKELDASRQKLEIELAPLREMSGRVDGLTAQAGADRATILALTEKHSTAAASVVDRDTAISEFKEQVATLSQQIEEAREKLNESEVVRAAMQSTISERETALKEERQQFTETKAAFKAQFAELSAEL